MMIGDVRPGAIEELLGGLDASRYRR